MLCTMKTINESEKISLAECKKVMSSRGKKYTDEELLKIRNWIYAFTEITLQFLETKTDEELKELKTKLCKK